MPDRPRRGPRGHRRGKPLPEGAQQAGRTVRAREAAKPIRKAARLAAAHGPGRGQTGREVGEGPPGGREKFAARRGERDVPRPY
ncbi:hypothetical protein GCM10023191_045520 [Actinoallomurus oryzae]|uniref:Uncharacterized protein n=1 Tax=Actinoallomurus oryzae TaxID=502180 RepID=A0ABP8Q8B9_9ACTN